MRRFAFVLLVVALGAALAVPAAGAAGPPGPSTPGASVATFCRSTDRLVRFIAHAPDPRKLAGSEGRRVLRAFHADAPPDVQAATRVVVDSFGYLSRHGPNTLRKARDVRTADALLRAAVFAASHCRQRRIRQLAQGLVQRRLAQAGATSTSTSTTTGAR